MQSATTDFTSSVVNLHETESLRGRIRSSAKPGLAGKQPTHVFSRAFAKTDRDEGPGHDPHHMAQETGATDVNGHKIALLLDHNGKNLAPRRYGITIGGPKTGKVVQTDKISGGRLHGRQIEGSTDVPGIACSQRRAHRMLENGIAIPLSRRRAQSVETLRRDDDRLNGDIVGEIDIDAIAVGRQGKNFVNVEVDDETAGVNPGVGAPRGGNPQRHTLNLLQSRFEDLLDRQTVALNLPATIVGTIIFNSQANDHNVSRAEHPA